MKRISLSMLLAVILMHQAHGEGCLVDKVLPNSPAHSAELKVGDVILAANGHTIRSHDDLTLAVNSAGSDLRMFVRRGDKTLDVTALINHASFKTKLGVNCVYDDSAQKASTAFAASVAPITPPAPIRTVPPHMINVGFGGAFPFGVLDTDDYGAGEQTMGSAGYTLGAQYFYGLTPKLEVGAEVNYSDLGVNSFTNGPSVSEISMNSTVFMALAKYHRPRDSNLTPYGLFGIGVHHSEFVWDLRPAAGWTWGNSPTNETRNIVANDQTGFAMALGLGMDLDLTLNSVLSFEARLDFIGNAKYEPAYYGRVIGLESVTAGNTLGTIGIRYGYRFGSRKNPAPAPAPPAEASPQPPV